MSKAAKKEEGPSSKEGLGKTIAIQRTDLSTFDDSFSFLKEKFEAEMKKVDEEMNKFSADLVAMYAQSTSSPVSSAKGSAPAPTWDSLAGSPLIQGEGDDKMLKLQFDLSQFEPSEIKIHINENVLIVSALHEEVTDNSEFRREFKREFLLPRGTNPDSVISSLSRDGVLTVQAPLPKLEAIEEKQNEKVLSKNPQDAKPASKQDSKTPQALPKAAEEKIASPAAGQTPSVVSPGAPTSPTAQRKVSKIGSKSRK